MKNVRHIPSGRSVHIRLHAEQIYRVYTILLNYYPALVTTKRLLYQYNVPVHRSRIIPQKLKESGEIYVLPHPMYSPDTVPPDHWCTFLRGCQFNTFNELESALQ